MANCCNTHPQLQHCGIILYYFETVNPQRVEIARDKKNHLTARKWQTVVTFIHNYNIMEKILYYFETVNLQKVEFAKNKKKQSCEQNSLFIISIMIPRYYFEQI